MDITSEIFQVGGEGFTSPRDAAVYLVASEGLRVLFGQDVHGPLDRRLRSNRSDYRDSLERMAALDADVLCEGHFGVIRGQGAVRRFIRSFL